MPLAAAAKALVRTAWQARSLRTARLLHTARVAVAEARLPGFAQPFRFRTGTSDSRFLRGLLAGGLPREYRVELDPPPRVVLDIGGNIGAVTAALVRRWPAAQVYAFEPLPENYALLRHNTAQFPQVTALPYGLGAATARRAYTRSDNARNFGGGGFHAGAGTLAGQERLAVVAVAEALTQLRIGPVDLVKIDTEGAEHEILTSFPRERLAVVRAIVGELHGKPGDGDLLDFLSTFFTVERVDRRGRPTWFRALRRRAVPAGGGRSS